MTATDKKPRLLRRIFRHKDASDEVSSSTERLERLEISNIPNKKSKEGSRELATAAVCEQVEDESTGLWGEVYNSFLTTTTPDLRAIVTLLRDQSKAPKSTFPNHQSSEASASPEWQLCREVLRMAESQKAKAEAEKGEEPALTQRLRRAYSGVITWTQKFVALGDVVSQVDPVHIGLPWAAIRAVLTVRDYNLSGRLFYLP